MSKFGQFKSNTENTFWRRLATVSSEELELKSCSLTWFLEQHQMLGREKVGDRIG